MQTNTVCQKDRQLLIVKTAEYPKDRDVLSRINKNIAYVKKHYPDIAQTVVAYNENQLIISGVQGVSFTSESAVNVYSHNEWILDSIIDILNRFQKNEYFHIPLSIKIRILFYPVLRGALLGCRIFPGVIKSLAHLLVSKVPWVDSHCDFTVYNLIVNDELKSVSLVDWETFCVMPKYYDFFNLIFNHSISIEKMTWQHTLAEKYWNSGKRDELTSDWAHKAAIFVLFRYYFSEVYRQKNISRDQIKSKYPGKKLDFFKIRADIRLENLTNLTNINNWNKLIGQWTWG